ncbi:2Fe-2S iron-sulfur cluster-binding protein [Sphingomonas sp.]|uniref:2Fe-2S iron-sulfur cluster-binding protein n=1 Tax=Sphingomonas sp. TaxID=28214 RepID=UPI003D6CAB3F
MSGWRLATGGTRIDRARSLTFRWGGEALTGFAGDTLASALLANGIDVIGRSFKYHRPRGLIAAGLEEPNGIVQLETGAHSVPNMKATQVELYEGLVAAPVNSWPSPNLDLMAVNGIAKRFIPAAFYYKTFMWPSWKLFEPWIRKAAGLGIAPTTSDPDAYEHRFAHVDTLVVGGGAAGRAAALDAAGSGERVLLIESEPTLDAPLSAPNLTVLTRTLAFGYYDHDLVALAERLTDHLPPAERCGPRQRLWKVRAGRVILATGAFERPLAFAHNDLPGVMLASAARTYAERYGVAVGQQVVLATTNDSAYASAFALHDAGIEVAAIVDSRADAAPVAEAAKRGIRVIAGQAPVTAKGGRAVKAVTIGPVRGGATGETLLCDALLMSGGWNPAVHLHSQSGGRLGFDASAQAFLATEAAQNATLVGAAAGQYDFDATVGPTRDYADGDPAAAKAWLDFQNDVTVGDVQLAVRENFRSVEHVKRYTTLGMASDQGKTSNVAGIRVMAGLLDKAPEAIGTTKFRPPFDPVTIGVLAGRAVGDDLMPLAHTPSENAAKVASGVFENYGGWSRPAYFAKVGEDEQAAVAREVLAVRRSVGLFDASPLGKIEVKGRDAAEFLERIYVNQVKTLRVGRCRYGLMLSENGVVWDDGVFARIAEDHFLVGTTSGHASAAADMLQEWLQCEWPHLEVLTENVTTGWAVMNVAGPKARDVLSELGTDIDLASASFPHMAYREGKVGGVRARVQRVSFTGELSYEVAVPWGYGAALWDALLRAGCKYQITPFGVEALMAMRIEKGFLHVGSDTDGTTLPQDVGFGAVVAKKASDFVGRRSTTRPDGLRTDRRQLIGVEVTDGKGVINAGAHVLPADAREPCGTEGWVTSTVLSPTLGRPLAMALVRQGQARIGEAVRLWDMGEWREGRLTDPRFHDPEGGKLDG